MEKSVKPEQVLRCLWLEYFNRALLEKRMIDEVTYHRMLIAIREKYRVTTPMQTIPF